MARHVATTEQSKLGARVPTDVHRALRLAAVEDERRQDEIVTEALQQWLQRRARRLASRRET